MALIRRSGTKPATRGSGFSAPTLDPTVEAPVEPFAAQSVVQAKTAAAPQTQTIVNYPKQFNPYQTPFGDVRTPKPGTVANPNSAFFPILLNPGRGPATIAHDFLMQTLWAAGGSHTNGVDPLGPAGPVAASKVGESQAYLRKLRDAGLFVYEDHRDPVSKARNANLLGEKAKNPYSYGSKDYTKFENIRNMSANAYKGYLKRTSGVW